MVLGQNLHTHRRRLFGSQLYFPLHFYRLHLRRSILSHLVLVMFSKHLNPNTHLITEFGQIKSFVLVVALSTHLYMEHYLLLYKKQRSIQTERINT